MVFTQLHFLSFSIKFCFKHLHSKAIEEIKV